MSLSVLIPLSLTLGLVGLGAFFWALRSGQFDDPEGAAWRILPPDPAARRQPGVKGPDDGHMASDPDHRDAATGL